MGSLQQLKRLYPADKNTVLSATATNFEAMVLGRILVGLGIGVSSAIVPLYISEVIEQELRLVDRYGKLAVLQVSLAFCCADLAHRHSWSTGIR